MAKLPSRVAAGGPKDVKVGRTSRLLLGFISAVLVTVAAAAGDPPPTPDRDDRSAEQIGRPSPLFHNSEAGQKSPPPAAGSAYESKEDCE